MIKNLLVILAFAAFIFFYVRYIEKRSLYIPYREIERTPDSVGLEFEDLMIKASDGVLVNSWWIPAAPEAETVFFFHGNGGNLSHRLEKILFFHKLGLNVFIIDYRGYGKSTGSPSENGLYLDATAGYDHLTRQLKIREASIILYGESLGSAVAIDLASKKNVGAIITEGAFTNVKDMARAVYPVMPSFFLGSKFDSLAKISGINVPKLMIHSRNDEIIPYALGKKLFDAAGEPKYLLLVEGGHNECFYISEDKIREKIIQFIKEP
ncbi:MAG TPA: alpha/beta hydrolase [Candidatus Omnitrophica bacterium]|nr:alpha/beta hydrolase [Candidatus Omnitrophota bacterium]